MKKSKKFIACQDCSYFGANIQNCTHPKCFLKKEKIFNPIKGKYFTQGDKIRKWDSVYSAPVGCPTLNFRGRCKYFK